MTETGKYKVSVVTAVYNVADYLEDMINSILSQTIGFENIQLILVDDGSQDASGELCDQYALKYPHNILVIHKENGGVSSARNEGLKHIKGKYVNFTDADDMLENTALEKMYDFLNKNKKWIDLVSVKMVFFGKKEGNHFLNYKFKKTRMIDLRKNYDCVQLAVNSTLIKRKCFSNRQFDTELYYAEDGQLIIDILLEKMRFGVISDTSYLYRKRVEETSALDVGKENPRYYLPCMKKFILQSLENAWKKKGYIPQFVQYFCMYDLQWRLKRNPLVFPSVLTKDEEEEYKALIIKAFQYIDNKIIAEQKYIGGNIKTAALFHKKGNKERIQFIPYPEDVKVCIDDLALTSAGSYAMFFEFFHIHSDEIIIEGYVRYYIELEPVTILLKDLSDDNASAEYFAKISEREEKRDYCMDETITQAKGFQFRINRNGLPDKLELQLCLRYKGNDIICKRVSFGKFFPVSKQLENSYFYQDGILLTHSNNILKLSIGANKKSTKKWERKCTWEILKKKDKVLLKGWILRKLAHILKPFKKKELWLISDRLTKADDNGEVFFTYLNTQEKAPHINSYFVLSPDSEDYERLRKIGKVVSYQSRKYKLLAILCDKIISSQADEYVLNCFPKTSFLYRDISHMQKFIFLQHGVIKDDLSNWLSKSNKNISLFVTTTHTEYQSILDYPYYYDKSQVKLTGLPRYDYLTDRSDTQNLITFMPTWRRYLLTKLDMDTNSYILKNGFENSSYRKMYQQIFSDKRLYKAAEKYHYTLGLMLHPLMPHECIDYFQCQKEMEIFHRNTRYRDLFADSKMIITDYSSAVFDFAYLRKPVLYYQQDKDEFFSGKHTLTPGYFDYETDGFGEVEYTAEAIVSRIIEYMENGCKLKELYRNRIENTFSFQDKNNCKRVYEEICKL